MDAHVFDLCYATHDGVPLLADLYRPPACGPHPVVVAISGGGWRVGSRSGLAGWGTYLAAHGYALCAIDHRKATHGKMFPEAVQDVMAALRYLSGEQAALRIDASRMVLMGSSAGAHLAALAALAGDHDNYAAPDAAAPHAAERPSVRAMILAYGVYDLAAQWQHGLTLNQAPGEDRVERFLGATPYDDPLLYHRASPLRQISYRRNKIGAMLVWGDCDEAVPHTQSLAFAAALQQAQFRVRFCPVRGAGHYWFTDDPIEDARGFASFVAPRVVRFLAQTFPAQPFHQEG